MYLLPVLWKMIQEPELAALVHSLAVHGRIFDDREYDTQGRADMALPHRLPLPKGFRDDPAYKAAIVDLCDLYNNFQVDSGIRWRTSLVK